MDRAEPQAAHLRAGVASGLAALSAFLILHAIWIVPIWTIVPVGFVLASAGGAAVGLAYVDVLPRLPTSRPRRWIAVDAAIAAVFPPRALAGTAAVPTELAILAIEATVAAVVLVEGHAFLIREPPAAREAGAAVRPS